MQLQKPIPIAGRSKFLDSQLKNCLDCSRPQGSAPNSLQAKKYTSLALARLRASLSQIGAYFREHLSSDKRKNSTCPASKLLGHAHLSPEKKVKTTAQKNINVTKSYLPDKEKFKAYVDQIYANGWLTNNGQLVRELEKRLRQYLGVKHLVLVANGSLALQVAYKALGLIGEAITTPFSFPATTSTLLWEGIKPVFADINPQTFNLDPANIEPLITKQTSAIVPVHVFGNPCEVEAIQAIAHKHRLKIIYDAAHAFGSKYKNQSVLSYGDISTLSFHATKLFHTIEGGAVITNNDELARKIRLLINFGITGPTTVDGLGTNAKMNEFEAAMGLCVLDEIETIKKGRALVWQTYHEQLQGKLGFQQWNPYGQNNHAYAPVLFDSEALLLEAEARLKENGIVPRRYFYPSLDTLGFFNTGTVCENSRDIASRILCLPMYAGLEEKEQMKIINLVKDVK